MPVLINHAGVDQLCWGRLTLEYTLVSAERVKGNSPLQMTYGQDLWHNS